MARYTKRGFYPTDQMYILNTKLIEDNQEYANLKVRPLSLQMYTR